MALGWLLLIFVVAIGVVASIFRPEARARVGWTAAAIVAFIVLYVGVDVARSLAQIRRDRQATERIATNEVQVDDLILAGTSDRHYRMSGLVHNQSPTYTLSDVRFEVVVLDCVNGECHEQGHGHVEVIRRVLPNQTEKFNTSIVSLPAMRAPVGERRFTTHVFLTVALP